MEGGCVRWKVDVLGGRWVWKMGEAVAGHWQWLHRWPREMDAEDWMRTDENTCKGNKYRY